MTERMSDERMAEIGVRDKYDRDRVLNVAERIFVTDPITDRHELLQALKAEREYAERTCEWRHDNTPDGWDTWEASCGQSLVFTEGSMEENNVNYCQYCGGRIVEKDND